MRLSVVAAAAGLGFVGPPAARGAPMIAAPPPPRPIDEPVIVHTPAYQIQLVALRFTYFDQDGLGYQSAAGPAWGPAPSAPPSPSRRTRWWRPSAIV